MDFEARYREARTGWAFFALPEFALVELRGADVFEWLQGQVTNDVRPLASGEPVSFCLCSPTGQTQAVCDAGNLDGRVMITCPRSCVQVLLNRVEQMVIMEDVEAVDYSADYHLLTVQGPGAEDAMSNGIWRLPNDRTGLGGFDHWHRNPQGSDGLEALDVLRLEAGFPAWLVDINERTLPPEMGPVFERRHVSYNKGCYVGQEVLQRLHSRGHTNKSWVGLHSDVEMHAGSPVKDAQGREVGKVTSAAWSPEFGFIAGAMLRNESANVPLTVDAQAVQVQPMPIRAG